LRHDFSQHLNQQLKALQNTTKLLHWVCRAQMSGASLLLPNMDQIKFPYSSRLAPENKYRLLYPAALNDMPDSPIIVKFVQQYNAMQMHIACWLLKV